MFGKALKGVFTVGTALALYELTARLRDGQRQRNGHDQWRVYHDPALVQRADAVREVFSIVSTGVPIHIDVYPQRSADAPVLLLNHGGATWSRMFIGQIMYFHDQGYTVIACDRRGQGLSGGRRGDTTMGMDVQNVVDVARWAKTRFNAPQYMIGFSMGGPVTYYAAAAGAPVEAICCFNLYDFSTPDSPGASLVGASGKFLARTWPLLKYLSWLSVPWLSLNRKMVEGGLGDLTPHVQSVWWQDPMPLHMIQLSLAHSMVTTPPAVPLEENQIPILVINPNRDKMTDPALTRHNYERLGGPKHYVEIPFGHFNFTEISFYRAVVDAADDWFKRYMPTVSNTNGREVAVAEL
jgi:alpha-beta hydrolase superfamily lysophospholipase